MRAAVRAQSLDVSTSSAATIQSGACLARLDPGKIANLTLRAPRYSARGRRLAAPAPGPPSPPAEATGRAGSVFMPICDRSAERSEACPNGPSAEEELTFT